MKRQLVFMMALLLVCTLCLTSCDLGFIVDSLLETTESESNAEEESGSVDSESEEISVQDEDTASENGETASETVIETVFETETVFESVEEFLPDVERKEYGENFNIFVEGSNGTDMYYMSADQNSGSPMDEVVYARQKKVEEYLGVNIIGVEYPDAFFNNYNTYVEAAISSKDGSLDALVTHVHSCVPNLISENLLADLSLVGDIDLDAEYWNLGFMESLEINGDYFLGYSDYNTINAYVIAFNKDMLALYAESLDKDIYDTVRDREWTLDKMTEIAGLVYTDVTGDGKTGDDTYGITGSCWVGFCGFLTSSDINMIEQDERGEYIVAVGNTRNFERTETLISKLRALASSPGAYFDYPPNYNMVSVRLTSGRALMQTVSTTGLAGFSDYDINFGVLPYPMYDLAQKDVGYKSLQWGGYIAAPSYMKNSHMTGDVLELLSFYSKNVNDAYLEWQLGCELSEAVDDVEMLDIVRDGLTADMGQTFIGVGNTQKGICYMVPELVHPNSEQSLEDYIKQKEESINTAFLDFVKGLD